MKGERKRVTYNLPVFTQNYKLQLAVNNAKCRTEVTLHIHLRCNAGLQVDKYGSV